MGRISRRFDHSSKQWSRSAAVAFIAIFSIIFCVCIIVIVDNLKIGNSTGIWIGSLNCAVSLINVLIGIQLLRAIARRLAAESRTTL
jgi:hypothetical protein